MGKLIGCPVSYHFDTFVHGVSLIACKLKNCWKFILKVTHSVKIFYLGSKTRMEINVLNNPSTTKLSYSKWKNAVLNPSKDFFSKKKSTLGFCRLLKDRCLKEWGKKPSSHVIHSLGGEYC